MRILMLNNEFPPLGGGTGTVNQAMLERFSGASDLEIDLVTSALGRVFEQEVFAGNIRLHKVPVRNRNIHHSSNRELVEYGARAFAKALKLHRENPYDLCFAWSAVPAGAVAWALRKIAGLRYIVRVCGPDLPGFEERYRTIHKLLRPLLRQVLRGADRVIAKSAREMELIRAVDARLESMLIPNGVDLNKFQPARPVPDDGSLKLLCVGRLIERKGQHHLIEVLKRLTDEGVDVTLDLVGTGDAQRENEAQVAALRLQERVRFLGYVPRDRIAAHYAAAHVFVLPSYNEGMSVALLEAMAAGLAVVVTPTGGTDELVEPEVNGLVFHWADVGALTAQLRRLARDRSLARKMGEASRRRAKDFSWDSAAQRYQEIFAQMLETSSPSARGFSLEAKHKI